MYGVLWGGVAGFLIGIYRAALFNMHILRYVMDRRLCIRYIP